MRKFKFRVWDKFFEEMHYFDFENNIDVRSGVLWITHKEGAVSCLSPSIKIMQYTGAKINGVGVYEGDILEDMTSKIPERRIVRYSEKDSAFDFGWNISYAKSQCEVIGNIYENPELLK